MIKTFLTCQNNDEDNDEDVETCDNQFEHRLSLLEPKTR